MDTDSAAVKKLKSWLVTVRIPVLVTGTELSGRAFAEQANTEKLSHFGATVVTKLLLGAGQEITLSGPDRIEVEARVVGKINIRRDRILYAVEFLNGINNLWGLSFPSLSIDSCTNTLLQCRSCQTRKTKPLHELELEVLRADDHLSLMCDTCRDFTVWGVAEHASAPHRADRLPPAEKTEAPAQEHVPEQTGIKATAIAQPPRNRRRNPRVSVNLKACIKQSATRDDIVKVLDWSRGGILVSSECVHRIGSLIEISVPYTPNAENIFVSARIVRRIDIGRKYEYGIEYVKGSLPR